MATELAKAYVQVIPSAKGIKGALDKEFGNEASSAGNSAGGKLVSALKGAIGAAGIGAFVGKALTEGADLQQSLGGVETMFKDNAGKVIEYANNAYATAGLSANQYMESVTSFSASLLQSLGGDTAAAAESANMALTDMSDNANKFGTDMESIQNAYQGFAKQNYTMLDNLKLGYGGTKEEMQRLLADAQKFSGVKYDINNLNDVYSAIHVIQEEMGVAGTTAAEASETFSGSFAAMKSAVSNVLANLTLGENIGPSLEALGETVITFVGGNLIPMVGNLITALPEALATSARILFTEVDWFGILTDTFDMVKELTAPEFLADGSEMLGSLALGFVENIPALLESAGAAISSLHEHFVSAGPGILEAGIGLIAELAAGIIANIPEVIGAAVEVTMGLLGQFASSLPDLLQKGIELICELAAGIISAIPDAVAAIPDVIDGIKGAFEEFDWLSIGSDIISGIAKGLSNGLGKVVEAAKEAASSAFEAAKDLLGINSPSKEFEWIGYQSDTGLALGITKNKSLVERAMEGIAGMMLDTPVPGKVSASAPITSGTTRNGSVDAILERLDMLIYLLELILQKDFKVIANKREVMRLLMELGVVFP